MEGNPSPRPPTLEQLYADTIDEIYSYVSARVGRSDGEELTAEVYCAAARRYHEGRGHEVTPAWLQTVARNKVVDRWRSAESRAAKAHLVTIDQETQQVDDFTERSSRRETVLRALDTLDETSRLLLVLRYIEGRPVAELSTRIGRSVDATNSALARARRQLKSAYAKESRDG